MLRPAVPAGIPFPVGPVGLDGTLSPSDYISGVLVDPGGTLPSSDLAGMLLPAEPAGILFPVGPPGPVGLDGTLSPSTYVSGVLVGRCHRSNLLGCCFQLYLLGYRSQWALLALLAWMGRCPQLALFPGSWWTLWDVAIIRPRRDAAPGYTCWDTVHSGTCWPCWPVWDIVPSDSGPDGPDGPYVTGGPIGQIATLSPSGSESAILVDPGGMFPSSDLARMRGPAPPAGSAVLMGPVGPAMSLGVSPLSDSE